MEHEKKFKTYDRIVMAIAGIALVAMLFTSCSPNIHKAPTKTPDVYVRGGSRNCGWAYN